MKRFNFYLDGVWQMVIVTDKSEDAIRAECTARHPNRTVDLVDADEDDFDEA